MEKNWRRYGEGGKNRWRNQTEEELESENRLILILLLNF